MSRNSINIVSFNEAALLSCLLFAKKNKLMKRYEKIFTKDGKHIARIVLKCDISSFLDIIKRQKFKKYLAFNV